MDSTVLATVPDHIKWVQETGETATRIEVHLPLQLPDGVRPKDLAIRESGKTLIVSARGSTIHSLTLVSSFKCGDWNVVNGVLQIEITKEHAAPWPYLIAKPIPADHPLLVPLEELDARLRVNLPPIRGHIFEETSAPSDDILDDALDEVEGTPATALYAEITTAEMKAYAARHARLKQLREAADQTKPETDEDEQTVARQRGILDEALLSLSRAVELRRSSASVAQLIEVYKESIRLDRLMLGQTTALEEETHITDEERGLSGSRLCAMGIETMQNGDVTMGTHYLRLAACQHGDPQAIAFLLRLYSQLEQLPRGISLAFHRAIQDDAEPVSNDLCAQIFSSGEGGIMIVHEVLIYFFQRAAVNGSTMAIMGLARVYLSMEDNANLSDDARASVGRLYRLAIFEALKRGCEQAATSAAALYLTGQHGMPLDLGIAKELADVACACAGSSERSRIASDLRSQISRLAAGERVPSQAAAPPSPGTEITYPNAARIPPADGAPQGVVAAAPRSTVIADVEPPRGTGANRLSLTQRRPPPGTPSLFRHALERRVVFGSVLGYALYTVLFPLRLMMLPRFYAFVEPIVERVGQLLSQGP